MNTGTLASSGIPGFNCERSSFALLRNWVSFERVSQDGQHSRSRRVPGRRDANAAVLREGKLVPNGRTPGRRSDDLVRLRPEQFQAADVARRTVADAWRVPP